MYKYIGEPPMTQELSAVNLQRVIPQPTEVKNLTKKEVKKESEIISIPKKKLIISDFTDEMNNFATELYYELQQDSQNSDITQDDIADFTRKNFSEKMKLLFRNENDE